MAVPSSMCSCLSLPFHSSVAYEMALEQIIADLDDLEERVENLNVDQKTNEDILLNVLKRVDETEKDLRKVRQSVEMSEVVVGQVALDSQREPSCLLKSVGNY